MFTTCNYFFLQKQAEELQPLLSGAVLEEAWSSSKRDLYLLFKKGEESHLLQAHFGEDAAFVFLTEAIQPSKNQQPQFRELYAQKVASVFAFELERSFTIHFQSGAHLLFKMYGRQANAIYLEKEQPKEIFRTSLQNDLNLNLDSLRHTTQPDLLELAFISEPKRLEKAFPALAQVADLKGWETAMYGTRLEMLRDALAYLKNPHYSVVAPTQTLPEVYFYPESEAVWQGESALEAAREFARRYFSRKAFLDRKKSLLASLENERKVLERGIASAEKHLKTLASRASFSQQADVLMANLHQIPKGATEVQLDNFYTGGTISLQIKEGYSPQKWAEKLYQKAKNQRLEEEQAYQKLDRLTEKLIELEEKKNAIEQAQDRLELKPFEKAKKQEEVEKPQLPFRVFEVQGYQIWVGKNAKNNDELTNRYAHKEDLWLHARGVSGSHVIIRHRGTKETPKPVIEGAASIAAWYSEARQSGLVPVMYTLKKYVRKPKGAGPGAVVVEREEVVMVEPKLPHAH